MRLFSSKDFEGHWPVGTAAVVMAEDEAAARVLLLAELKEHHLSVGEFTLQEIPMGKPLAVVLSDGDY